ncbi:hypothetical protein Tsubulata_035302 [Turnera subulata]|uniref:Bet v I/Major latex protein domain-containing protein n=1 Tax=Turnera subulata TaxID=218843 RepID=A0A9Q0F687_9ROSI|nr:hypothetical protein Tsubulata_035302 [Turnera subulata]
MRGQVSADNMAEAPASAVWEAYRGLEPSKLINQLLGDVIGKVEVVHGDGGPGTILKLTFHPGTSGPAYAKEVIITMDDEKLVKEGEVIEGGFKELGFDFYHMRVEIIEKDSASTIIRSTITYELDDTEAELASLVTTKPLEIVAEAFAKYVTAMKSANE